MKIGQKIKRQLGFCMSMLCAISLAACGTKYADAPALLEPVSGTELWFGCADGICCILDDTGECGGDCC